ncbi:MAG: RICIN domain-containing protein [Lachnospiraceae bacterium]
MMLGNRGKGKQWLSVCMVLIMMSSLLCLGNKAEKVSAATSSLIADYKPQINAATKKGSCKNSAGKTISFTFYHPGIAMNQEQLDTVRDKVRAGINPWSSAFESFAASSKCSKSPAIYYQEGNEIFINVRGPWAYTSTDGTYYSNPSEYVGDRANKDASTAFYQAVMWYITGDDTYRSNAMKIIRSYASIESCMEHRNFRFATVTYFLASAAEILRYSDCQTDSLKWTNADTSNLCNMMELFSNTYNCHTYFMNQHQFCVMGTMAKAIFNDDFALYAEAVEATTVNSSGDEGGLNGSIKYQCRYMTKDEETGKALSSADYHVQLIEMGRDVGHSYDDIGGLSTLVQTMYHQNTKVDPITGEISTDSNAVNGFNFLDDRLLAGTTYLLKYHFGYDVLWTTASCGNGNYYSSINSDNRGRIDQFLGILYNYYKYIEKQDMTQEKYQYLAKAYESYKPESVSHDYPAAATLLYTPSEAVEYISDGYYYLKNVNSGLYLTVRNASAANGTLIEQNMFTGSSAQKFKITTNGNGKFQILTGASSFTKGIDVAGAKSDNGVNIIQWTENATANNQLFQFKKTDNGYGILTMISGGKSCLDVPNSSKQSGTGLIQWTYKASDNQLWQLEPLVSEGEYYIRNLNSGLYLDVTSGSSVNGTLIEQWQYNAGNAQRFKLVEMTEGVYQIYTACSDYKKVLDVANNTSKDGANVIIWTPGNGSNQQFKVERVDEGVYAIYTMVSGAKSSLNVSGSSKANGAPVVQWSHTGSDNALWVFESVN